MAYYQQQQQQADPTYFTEGNEQPERPRMGTRDAAKMIARQRQEIIASELSRIAGDEYLEDIMKHMRHMEVRRVGPQSMGSVADNVPG